jgi:hypothetical protein
MNEKDTLIQTKRLSSDERYYTNVFKKTEKLVSVTFYILSHIDKGQSANTHVEKVKEKAFRTHELSLKTLSLQPHEQFEGLLDFQYELLGFESTLRIAQAGGVIPTDILNMLVEQLDTVQRHINNHYTKEQGFSLLSLDLPNLIGSGQKTQPRQSGARAGGVRRQRTQVPAGDISSDAFMVYSQLTDRAERIRTVLEAKPQATIKDISEIITDVSEKTIQRELNSLIEKGQVVREGERRWSKYSAVRG